MAALVIRQLPPDILPLLGAQAEEHDYTTREAYIRQVLIAFARRDSLQIFDLMGIDLQPGVSIGKKKDGVTTIKPD